MSLIIGILWSEKIHQIIDYAIAQFYVPVAVVWVFVEDSAFCVVFLLFIEVAGVFVEDSAFWVVFILVIANIKRKIIEKEKCLKEIIFFGHQKNQTHCFHFAYLELTWDLYSGLLLVYLLYSWSVVQLSNEITCWAFLQIVYKI